MPRIAPSLSRAFEPERRMLETALAQKPQDKSYDTSQIVSLARRALDRTGQAYVQATPDPALQKAGLWLLEMVKTGASVLDQGSRAEIIWHEVPSQPTPKINSQGLFYLTAAGLFVAALLQGSRIGMITAMLLTAMRLMDPDNWRAWRQLLPFFRRPAAITDNAGRGIKAEAQILANHKGYVDALTEAVRTADHILLRLSEPELETHWRDNHRLMGFVQGLLEASRADDGDFALTLVRKELESILEAEGIRQVRFEPETAMLFDILPAPGLQAPREAAPALMAGDAVVRRGTVWGTGHDG